MKVTDTKRRAIATLFINGFSFREIGRLFKLPSLTVENIFRVSQRMNRRRR